MNPRAHSNSPYIQSKSRSKERVIAICHHDAITGKAIQIKQRNQIGRAGDVVRVDPTPAGEQCQNTASRHARFAVMRKPGIPVSLVEPTSNSTAS